jgi:hypothetical protein
MAGSLDFMLSGGGYPTEEALISFLNTRSRVQVSTLLANRATSAAVEFFDVIADEGSVSTTNWGTGAWKTIANVSGVGVLHGLIGPYFSLSTDLLSVRVTIDGVSKTYAESGTLYGITRLIMGSAFMDTTAGGTALTRTFNTGSKGRINYIDESSSRVEFVSSILRTGPSVTFKESLLVEMNSTAGSPSPGINSYAAAIYRTM